MKTTAAALLAVSSLAALSTEVEGHGYISFPKAQYKDPATATNYNAIITASINTAFAGKKWNDNPTANANTFTAAFKKSGYTSLRQMLDKKVPGCQNSRTDITPVNVKGATSMKWQNDWEHKGFIDSHHGPCEVWIDNTRVFHHNDCVAAYKTYPAVLPINYAACKTSKCTLTFYWLALHEPNWQIYKHCVPITNSKKLRD
uniref:Uncharacterized protein n=1 Tax=Globisporangium ultimum (strain ATCC 200006 / CBS 805.95 / DAOM BR144) TaxID=431595 RepID=K3WLN7_GLOUD